MHFNRPFPGLGKIILVCSVLVLLASVLTPNIFKYREIASGRYSRVNFDSNSKDIVLSSVKEFPGKPDFGSPYARIRFKLKADKITQYNNAFQTADLNYGIRLEFTAPSRMTLVAGHTAKRGGIKGFGLTNNFKPGEWYDFEFRFSGSGRIQVLLNRKVILDRNDSTIRVSFSRILVGAGYDAARRFCGEIRDFQIDYRLYSRRLNAKRVLAWFKSLGAAGLVLAGFLLFKSRRGRRAAGVASFPASAITPVLAGIYPVLFLFSVNIREVPPKAMLLALLVSALAAVVLFVLLSLFFRNAAKASAASSVLLLGFFSAGRVHSALFERGLAIAPDTYVLFFLAAGAAIVLLIDVLPGRLDRPLCGFLAIMFAVLLVPPLFAIALKAGSNHPGASWKSGAKQPVRAVKGKDRPDIYYIILDTFASKAALERDFGYKDPILYGFLRKNGFVLPKNSHSNYRSTSVSLPSSLNMEYLDKYAVEKLPLEKMPQIYEDNKAAAYLKGLGYKFVVLNPNEILGGWNRNADVNIKRPYLNNFNAMLINTTLLFTLPKVITTIEREKVLGFFEDLANIPGIPGPKFIYAHVLSPHPPYLFRSDGSMTFGASQYDAKTQDARGEIFINKDGYLNQLQFIEKSIIGSIANILRTSPRPPVIILQSDHGPDLYNSNFVMDLREMVPPEVVRTRFEILNAYYLPGKSGREIYDNISPVNSFRVVFNMYFNGGFKVLDDRSYYSPDEHLFTFKDVTELVRPPAEKKTNQKPPNAGPRQ